MYFSSTQKTNQQKEVNAICACFNVVYFYANQAMVGDFVVNSGTD